MPNDVAALRRATRAAFLLALAVLVALGLLFGVVLHPEVPARCTTGLYPGPYGDALVPAHLAAFLVLTGLVAWLGAVRTGRRRPPARSVAGLAAVAVLAGAFAAWPPLGLAMLVVGPLAGFALLVLGGLQALATARAGLDERERWRRHARVVEAALWAALLVVLPLMFGFAWLNGSGLFCF
jgi:hypothetical protein